MAVSLMATQDLKELWCTVGKVVGKEGFVAIRQAAKALIGPPPEPVPRLNPENTHKYVSYPCMYADVC